MVRSFKCTSVNPQTEKCLSSRTGIDYKMSSFEEMVLFPVINRKQLPTILTIVTSFMVL